MSKPEGQPIPGGDGTKIVNNTSVGVTDKLEELGLNDLVVETKDMVFTYDKKKGNLLNKINMTFPRSAIYGFLGPSGCGKTTMIKLIIGELTPTSGTIRVNGKAISDPTNKIPGIGVGYMPQEYALYTELTINEILNYFGRIYGLSSDYMKKRIDFLMKFLELPDPNRLAGVLSGGQKRRTSLAVALIHNPRLLILDEPTVGVDPMLRERIWQHLVYLSAREKISIMITTHYIDECRRAHVIGLMRGGHLLVENSPTTLMNHFQTRNLEVVFLEVCKGEEQKIPQNLPPSLAQVRESGHFIKKTLSKGKVTTPSFSSSFLGRFMALFLKNGRKLLRQKLFIVVLILVPLIATVLVCTTFGKKPYNLRVAVYNEEEIFDTTNKFSQDYLKKIDTNTIILESHNSNESALDSVRNGQTFGALIIHRSFSDALVMRLLPDASIESIESSTIKFFADTTDLMIFQSLFQTLRIAELAFHQEMIRKVPGANPRTIEPIISLSKPIYGSLNPEFRDFAAPGFLILSVYLFSMAVTTLDIVTERSEGTLDRTLVSGVKMLEMLLSLISVQFFILVIQTLLMILIVIYVFEIENNGNLWLIITLMIIQGLQGMACGLFMSAISYDELMALQICVGIFLPLILISGVLWPLEGMPIILRTISLFTPETFPIMSLRNIMLKGWGLEHTMVWIGYCTSFAFFILFIILAIIASNLVTYQT